MSDGRPVRITLENLGITIDSGSGSILDSALRADLPFPHGCRSGTCGMCVTRVLMGSVEVRPGSTVPLIEPGGDAGHVVLACRAVAASDVTVQWLGETEQSIPPVKRVTGEVRELTRVGRDVIRIRVELEGGPLAFLPGQYAELSVSDRPARPFSMANPPTDPVLEFHIRHLTGGQLSGFIAAEVGVGDRFHIRGPLGSAYLRYDGRPILAAAGGVGIAPIRSMLLTSLGKGEVRPIHLYFGARDEPDLYCIEELEGLGRRYPHLRIVPVLSDASGVTSRRVGFVHEAIRADFQDLSSLSVYAAGPPPMVEALKDLTAERGLAPDRIFMDPFLPHQQPRNLRKWASLLLNRISERP